MPHNQPKNKKNKKLTVSVPIHSKPSNIICLGTVKTDHTKIICEPTHDPHHTTHTPNKQINFTAIALVYYEDSNNMKYGFRGIVDILVNQAFPSHVNRHTVQCLFNATNTLKLKLASNTCVIFVRRNGKITIEFANGLTLSFSKRLNVTATFCYMSSSFISRRTYERIMALCTTIPTKHGTFLDNVAWDEGFVYVVTKRTTLCYKIHAHNTYHSFAGICHDVLDVKNDKNVTKIPRNILMTYDSYNSLTFPVKSMVTSQMNNFVISYSDETKKSKDCSPYLVSAKEMVVI